MTGIIIKTKDDEHFFNATRYDYINDGNYSYIQEYSMNIRQMLHNMEELIIVYNDKVLAHTHVVCDIREYIYRNSNILDDPYIGGLNLIGYSIFNAMLDGYVDNVVIYPWSNSGNCSTFIFKHDIYSRVISFIVISPDKFSPNKIVVRFHYTGIIYNNVIITDDGYVVKLFDNGEVNNISLFDPTFPLSKRTIIKIYNNIKEKLIHTQN